MLTLKKTLLKIYTLKLEFLEVANRSRSITVYNSFFNAITQVILLQNNII